MTNEKRQYKPGDEIGLDIFTQMKELQKSAHKLGSYQLEPGEVYLSGECYEQLVENVQFYGAPGSEPDHIFGLPIYRVPVKGYHVRVASRLVMRPGVEL